MPAPKFRITNRVPTNYRDAGYEALLEICDADGHWHDYQFIRGDHLEAMTDAFIADRIAKVRATRAS